MQQVRRVLAYMAGGLPMAVNAAGTTERRHHHMQAPNSQMLYQAQAKVTYRALETSRKTRTEDTPGALSRAATAKSVISSGNLSAVSSRAPAFLL